MSDPTINDQKVLIVNLTTLGARKEQVCILQHGDHPWVTHPTCVNYGDSRITTLAKLDTCKDAGLLQILDPMPAAVLKRIRDSALDSARIPIENADVLIEQGLVDF